MPGPVDTALPTGLRVALDRQILAVDDGAVLFGGAPPRMLLLSQAARALLADGGAFTVTDATSAALARRLLDVGIAHPVTAPAAAVPAATDVTVVVPVKDRVAGLERLLAALPAGLGGLVVVDDGSADPAAIRRVAERAGARVLRHPAARGPAAARNAGLAVATTPLVAFLDSDVVPEPGWLEPLLACFADPAVGLAAPRIVALPPIRGWLATYEAVRSSLDMGPEAAPVVPRSRVAYVPSAALLVHRNAVGDGFDERMHVAEDVDLVLRLHAARWRMRYQPVSRVAHDHRTTLRAWWLRKAYYGTGAAPLAQRHPGSVPPMVLTPSSAAVAALLLLGRPVAALGAVAVTAASAERLARKLELVRNPRPTAARLVGLGTIGTLTQTADAVTRHYWPLALAACLVSRRARRTVAAVALAEGVVDWWRRRGGDPRPTLAGHVLARRLDDLAYGSGLWWGALRHRTVEPLRPIRPGPDTMSRVG
ncbi:mycofactocin biosynthesis glycosyltransferase MftF [Pseudonocardia nigra]|uniref:mycofactocin biosynthesis glycosyltransferase MftF n=1 Tax=Pseudonocardia nigra TaxID=1921578 RepID=UPI001C605104|nr:mycofactocin biosynthesis glycosyltransferase MftF [Pseudonocardia nigra]